MANNISLKKTITTSSFQCDFSRNMKISAMQRIFQDVADWHCAKFQLDFDSLREYDLAFLVSRIHIHIYQPPKFGDKLTVSTWHHTEIGAQFIRNSNITRGKTMLVEASTSWLLYSPALHKICRPNMLPRELPHCSRKVEPKIDKFIVPSDIKLRSTHKVEYAEIDMNGHLNNSVYPDIICN
ncbi:MAG: thioesterase, partial [Clostridia bacterium]